ncbi:MAG TPA: DUF3618 domain-containing protein [Gemmatimonadaceae bacterium]|nr:DUF3618 domain-containing protein [Gemmatimonadaceae bacterium]
MAETTADVKRDIEMTRERISNTLAQLEQKTNVLQIVKDHPWPALAVAFGAGVLLSGSRADVKAAGATLVATRGASSRVGTVLDDVVSQLMTGLHAAFQHKIEGLVNEVKEAIGAPVDGQQAQRSGQQSQYGQTRSQGGSQAGATSGLGGTGAGTSSSGFGATSGGGNSSGGSASTSTAGGPQSTDVGATRSSSLGRAD